MYYKTTAWYRAPWLYHERDRVTYVVYDSVGRVCSMNFFIDELCVHLLNMLISHIHSIASHASEKQSKFFTVSVNDVCDPVDPVDPVSLQKIGSCIAELLRKRGAIYIFSQDISTPPE